MFCQNCGKQINEGINYCPNCGCQISSSVMSQQENVSVQEKDASSQQKDIPKKKRKWLIPIMIAGTAVIMLMFLFLSSSSSSNADELITMVQNGYLGHYDTVTIKEVLEYVYKDGEWNAGEAVEGDHFIVEYKGTTGGMQFSVEGTGAKDFSVSGVRAEGLDTSDMEAYDVKLYIDSLYSQYAGNFPEKGLDIDDNVSNDTLSGHIGPVKSIEESEYAVQYLSSQIKQDLSAYVDYSEEELIAELGYKKNEFGWYPEDTHMNFAFEDGKMYMITLNATHSEDAGMSLYGVSLYDSMDDADTVLKSKGFQCQTSYDISDGSTALYIEDGTGYGLSLSSDEKGSITSIGYMKDTDMILYDDELDNTDITAFDDYDEGLTNNESDDRGDINPISIVDGIYTYDQGSSYICNAEVGFSPDRGGNYIYIECWGYGGHELIDFEGVLEENDDGSYYAYFDVFDASITVVFVEGGLYVQVYDSDNADMFDIQGYYTLESE